jgi:hypothetical protein
VYTQGGTECAKCISVFTNVDRLHHVVSNMHVEAFPSPRFGTGTNIEYQKVPYYSARDMVPLQTQLHLPQLTYGVIIDVFIVARTMDSIRLLCTVVHEIIAHTAGE